ncbi:MAG: tetratricopeptide repeat protein [Candidatus Humimicrobiaceae bacterium]
MYEYKRRNKLGFGSILWIILFIMAIISQVVLYFMNKGKFWDILPIASIVIIVLSLILAIFNMARRADGGFVFIIFFIIFLGGLVLSSLYGPFALNNDAQKAVDAGNYSAAIKNYTEIIDKYSTSKYYNPALKNIADNFNKIGDSENTIKYLSLAIEKKIVDPESIEAKRMFSDSYSKIAEKAYGNGDYSSSSLNYILAINVLKEIYKNFPNSDDAFISTYKIPQYLYKAADSYKKIENFNQSIEILKELIRDYPESDWAKQSGNMIFNSYFEDAMALIENLKYREALDEYFIALEYASSGGNQVSSGSYDIQIFSKIPKDTLLEYAAGISTGGKYADALKILSYMLVSYPEMSPSINPYYAICKIAIISKTSYEKLPEIGGPFKIKNPGNFVLTLSNKTEKELIFYFSSSGGSVFILQAKGRLDITLPMGSCEIAVEASDNTPPVYYGQLNFEENKKYSMTFLKIANNTSTTK